MSGNRGRKDTMRDWFDRVYRCPAAYDELIGRTGVKGARLLRLGSTDGPTVEVGPELQHTATVAFHCDSPLPPHGD
jgi:hypothetical protein